MNVSSYPAQAAFHEPLNRPKWIVVDEEIGVCTVFLVRNCREWSSDPGLCKSFDLEQLLRGLCYFDIYRFEFFRM